MNAQAALGVVIVGLLITYGGFSLASKYIASDSEAAQIEVIMQDTELTPTQRVVLVQMVNLKKGLSGPDGYQELAKYFNETADNFKARAVESKSLYESSGSSKYDAEKQIDPNFAKYMHFTSASGHFRFVAKECEKPEPDIKKILYEVHIAFDYLKVADIDPESVLPAAPKSTSVEPAPVPQTNSIIPFATTLVGLIVAALGAIAGFFQLRQSVNEKNKAQLELAKMREANQSAAPIEVAE